MKIVEIIVEVGENTDYMYTKSTHSDSQNKNDDNNNNNNNKRPRTVATPLANEILNNIEQCGALGTTLSQLQVK